MEIAMTDDLHGIPPVAADFPAPGVRDLAQAGHGLAHGYCADELDTLPPAAPHAVRPGAGERRAFDTEPSSTWRQFDFDHTRSAGSLA
jgi:hypothetical protein